MLFVVESVGKSGFDEPGIRQLIESTKQKFKLHSLTFSSIEGGFPATTRSHLALQTGGLALTLGALNDELLEMKAPFHLSRAFAEKKYKTGVFTPVKWDFENLDRFYRHLQWDRIFDYRRFSEKDLKKIGGNSWGYDEKPFFDEMERWLLAGSARKFAVYINNNTHHPYQAASVSLLDDARTRYRKSAAELITRIQGLVESLSNRGVLDRFVIGITGDHGEAFGEVHKGNFLHRNALYEENLGNELILLSSSMKSDAERSNLISQGDVFPTLTDLFSLKTPPLGHSYYLGVRKLIFFHKLATPEEWGLRDGEWKFIERRFGPEEGALFNLHDDPREQINRLPEFRDRGRLYSSLIKEWFWEKRNEFYRSTGLPLTQASLGEEDFLSASRSGIQRVYLVPGHHQRERSYLEFIRPTDRPCFLLLVNIGGEKRNAHLSLVSPSGKKFGFDQPVLPEWRRIWVTPSLPLPLEVGTWRVFSGDQGRMLKTEFKVKS
ncbi:MAG: hypothetical protein EBX52_07760 [Proteobacteria bacterium]|nr:hypothetical protein [Pseudomonadota bacterium]